MVEAKCLLFLISFPYYYETLLCWAINFVTGLNYIF
ncbi:hypothetical protein EVA_16600 [gut metagenome]|uniref:Uncharacterized protein n=1 Tax=gut metagenome TaxID=749906 RepID=J9FLI1_9ZZZZ